MELLLKLEFGTGPVSVVATRGFLGNIIHIKYNLDRNSTFVLALDKPETDYNEKKITNDT